MPCTFGLDEIRQLVEMIWTTTLDWEVTPADEVAEIDPPAGVHTGSVAITGDWTGSVVLHCDSVVGAAAAARMFAMPIDDLPAELIQDALGELTNILAGNLKGLLGGRCYLGLPTVVEGGDYAVCLPGSRRILRAGFLCANRPILVDVHEREDDA